MKRVWDRDELVEHWSLTEEELTMVRKLKTEAGPLGFALLLKWFQYEGRFPQHRIEVPNVVLAFLARQLNLTVEQFATYDWQGRTMERHRAQIRQFFGFREATIQDRQVLADWLLEHTLPQTRQWEALKAALYTRCRELQIEPPGPSRVERLLRSVLRIEEERFCNAISHKLSEAMCARLDALLE